MLLKEVERDNETMQSGWICPKCRNSISPTEKVCPTCNRQNVNELRENDKELLLG